MPPFCSFSYLGPALGVKDDVGLRRQLLKAAAAGLLDLDTDAGVGKNVAKVLDASERHFGYPSLFAETSGRDTNIRSANVALVQRKNAKDSRRDRGLQDTKARGLWRLPSPLIRFLRSRRPSRHILNSYPSGQYRTPTSNSTPRIGNSPRSATSSSRHA